MNTEKDNELTTDKILQDVLYYISYSGHLDDRVTTEKARDRIIKYGQRMYDEGEKNSKQQSKWIPVEERPPQEDQIVIYIGDGRRPSMAKYQKGQFIRYVDHVEGERVFVIQYTNITHWQPSPDLPEQGKEK